MGKFEQKLNELDVQLPSVRAPTANYVASKRVGNTLLISGTMPIGDAGPLWEGILGRDLSVAEGQQAARTTATFVLAHAKEALGDLDRIDQCLKLEVFVRATPEFTEHPKVANGASDLLADVFGDRGKHARFAIGVASLPFGVPVEIAATFSLHP